MAHIRMTMVAQATVIVLLLILVEASEQSHVTNDEQRPALKQQERGDGGALVDFNVGPFRIRAGGGGADGRGGGGFGGVSFGGIDIGGFGDGRGGGGGIFLPGGIVIGGGGGRGGGGGGVDIPNVARIGGGGGPEGGSGGIGQARSENSDGFFIGGGGGGGGSVKKRTAVIPSDFVDQGQREAPLAKRQNGETSTASSSGGGGLLGGGGLAGGLSGLLGDNSDPSTFFSGLFGVASGGAGTKQFKQPGSDKDDSVFFYQDKPKRKLASGEAATHTYARFKIVKDRFVGGN